VRGLSSALFGGIAVGRLTFFEQFPAKQHKQETNKPSGKTTGEIQGHGASLQISSPL
jgi:hypothetical protein